MGFEKMNHNNGESSERRRLVEALGDSIQRFLKDESGRGKEMSLPKIDNARAVLAAGIVTTGVLAGGIAINRSQESVEATLPYVTSPSIVPRKSDAIKQKEIAESMSEKDWDSLIQNVYHESRGELESGQLAVAQITLARVGKMAKSVTEAVYQDKQFSWTENPIILMTPMDHKKYSEIQTLLRTKIANKSPREAVNALSAITGVPEDVLHYKSTSLKEHDPKEKKMSERSRKFFQGMTVVKTIGTHAFYAKIPIPKPDPRVRHSKNKKAEV